MLRALMLLRCCIINRRKESEAVDKPLAGQVVAVTRTPEQAEGLVDMLGRAGAEVLVAPTLLIGPVADYAAVDAALGQLDRYDYLVLTSANGVEAMLGRLRLVGCAVADFSHLRIAAIGAATARRLEANGFAVDLIPPEAVGEVLARALLEDGAGGKRILLLRAEQGRAELVRLLIAAGCQVSDLPVYRTESPTSLPPALIEHLTAGRLSWITVTSPSCWRNLLGLLGPERSAMLARVRLASIGPVTSRAIRATRFEPTVEADPHDAEGLVKVMLKFESGAGNVA